MPLECLSDPIYLQINVVVFDDARPQLSATTTVTASILRNPSGPIFSQNEYTDTFHELEPVGYNPVTVSAPDTDGVRNILFSLWWAS